MFNENFIFLNNTGKYTSKIKIEKKQIFFYSYSNIFGIKDIMKLIAFINRLEEKKLLGFLPIVIYLGNASFQDKLTYMLLECVCFYLIKRKNCTVKVIFKQNLYIDNAGIQSSPLNYLRSGKKDMCDKFVRKFSTSGKGAHYRKLLRIEDNADKTLASKIMQDLDSFLKLFNVSAKYRNNISEVVSELVDNSLEHGESDCLIDIDVTEDYRKTTPIGDEKTIDYDASYYGVNIAVLNFSKYLLGSKLSEKLKEHNNDVERFSKIYEAHQYHQQHWNAVYVEDDFFNIVAFQHKISSRNSLTGGTGLTKLLRSLEEISDSYNCYVISGNRKLRFMHKYIKYNKDNWVGFNKESDFITSTPSEECVSHSDLFVPGTVYNLFFIMKREDNHE